MMEYYSSIKKNEILLFVTPCTNLAWRRKWQPTPVFLPRESCGQRSLVGCCPWGRSLIQVKQLSSSMNLEGVMLSE